MRKSIMRSLLPALAGASALTLHADPAWTSGSCAPTDWTALPNNLVAGLTGTISGAIATGYSTNDPQLLTNGEVPAEGGNKYRVGFQNTASISWTFATPRTIEKVRVSCGYLDGALYSGFTVSSVEVQAFGSTEWTALTSAAGAGTIPNNGQLDILSLVLTDGNDVPLAETIGALRVTFGTPPIGFANYCVEIEAVGFAEATGPVIGSLEVAPAKTKAIVSGSITDAGTDATACDIYLALGGGAAAKIAEDVTGAFSYAIKDLAPGTEYAYTLSVSNNAPTAKGTVRTGTFTTLSSDAQTASWTQGEYAPANWTALGNNILAGLNATERSGLSGYASSDMTKLTDGSVPELNGNMSDADAGANTVGFTPNGIIAWAFEKPMTIEKLRLSSLWKNTLYNGISVASIQVKTKGSTEWTTLDVPTVEWKGGSAIGQTETLSDAEFGFLAENVVALKITFGAQKAAVANYYAEIEAVGRPSTDPTVMVFR